eukprot:102862_1
MADEQYAAYCYEFGYPPKQPQHLIAFAKKNGAKVNWKQAKNLIKLAPDTSNYVPPDDDKPRAKKNQLKPQEIKDAKLNTAKRYSSNQITIDQDKLMGINKRGSALRYQYLITQLTAMGWDYDQSLAAIKAANGNLQLAIESLMNGDINKPMISINRAAQTTAAAQPSKPRSVSQSQHTTPPKSNTLQAWLNEIALGQYYNVFIQHGYGQQISGLSDLTDERLKAMGISMIAHRRTILKHIKSSNNSQSNASHAPQSNNVNQSSNVTQAQPMSATQVPPTQDTANATDDAFDKLLSGHGSIKQRLAAMDHIYANLDQMDISSDNGKVLLSAYGDQILHEDYIYRDYAVRIKAIQQIVDVFIFCLNRTHYNQLNCVVEDSLAPIFDNLWILLDNNRARKFHDMCRECIRKLIDAVVGKSHKTAMVDMCGLLNGKMNTEEMTQAHARFFAAQLMFDRIIFGFEVPLVHDMFEIDIDAYDNKLDKYTSGIPANKMNDFPQNRKWIDLVIAQQWESNEDETFKDIVADCVSMMMLDPNCDINTIGINLAVYFYQLSHAFRDSLEVEAKHRFSKYPVTVTPQEPQAQIQPVVQKERNVDPNHNNRNGGAVDYRIQQETDVKIGSIVLPAI